MSMKTDSAVALKQLGTQSGAKALSSKIFSGAALRVISALSALRWSKMIFRRIAQSRIAFSEKLRNTPSIMFSDLLESVLHLGRSVPSTTCSEKAVWDEKCSKNLCSPRTI